MNTGASEGDAPLNPRRYIHSGFTASRVRCIRDTHKAWHEWFNELRRIP
jgi:hypothetical protein